MKIIPRILNYFIQEYNDFPGEIQEKIKNYVYINIIGLFLLILGPLTVYIIYPYNSILLYGDLLILILIVLSLIFVRKLKPIIAENIFNLIIFTLFLRFILSDYLTNESVSILRLFESTIILIIGLFVMSSFCLKSSQFYFYMIMSNVVLIIHYIILAIYTYNFIITSHEISVLVECISLLVFSGIIAYKIFLLTLRDRTNLFSNILFYKFSDLGPELIYSYLPVDTELAVESGIYYYTALGLGQQYRTGLFGPLPFGKNENEIAIIYSGFVKDRAYSDQRLSGKNYCFTVLVTKKGKESLVNKNYIDNTIRNFLNDAEDISELTKSEINDYFRKLIN